MGKTGSLSLFSRIAKAANETNLIIRIGSQHFGLAMSTAYIANSAWNARNADTDPGSFPR